MLPDWSPPGHRDHLNSPPCSSESPLTTATTPSYTPTNRPSLLSFLVSSWASNSQSHFIARSSPLPGILPASFEIARILSAPPRTNPFRLSRTFRFSRHIKHPDSQSSPNVYCASQRDWRHVNLPFPFLQTRTLLSPAKLSSAPLTRNDVLVLG